MCVAVSSKKRRERNREISKETNIKRKLRKIWVICKKEKEVYGEVR